MNLAWWHTYKHCSTLLWKTFAQSFFGPMFHWLYPHHEAKLKPGSLNWAQSHFILIRFAWPHVKANLERVLTEENIQPCHRAMLDDIQFICEFAIPVVSRMLVLLSNCSFVRRDSLLIINSFTMLTSSSKHQSHSSINRHDLLQD